MNRIEMTEYQDTRLVTTPGRTNSQDISVSIPTRDTFYPSPERRRFRLHDIGQTINRLTIWGRCFYLDPSTNAAEDFLIINCRRISRYF